MQNVLKLKNMYLEGFQVILIFSHKIIRFRQYKYQRAYYIMRIVGKNPPDMRTRTLDNLRNYTYL